MRRIWSAKVDIHGEPLTAYALDGMPLREFARRLLASNIGWAKSMPHFRLVERPPWHDNSRIGAKFGRN